VRKPEDFGERLLIVLEIEAAVVADAVPAGERAGEQRRVRRKRQWDDGGGLLEAQPGSRELVDDRRLRVRVAIRADAVGPHGVERDEQEIAGPARSQERHADR
jgi:hypothetical protein